MRSSCADVKCYLTAEHKEVNSEFAFQLCALFRLKLHHASQMTGYRFQIGTERTMTFRETYNPHDKFITRKCELFVEKFIVAGAFKFFPPFFKGIRKLV